MKKIKQRMADIGKAMLSLGLQNTHSGNISARADNKLYITRTGSMKGHIEEDDIVMLDLDEKRIGQYKASIETSVHQKILKSFSSAIHAHSISSLVLSNIYKKIIPLDFLGQFYLKLLSVLDFGNNLIVKNRGDKIYELLKKNPAVIIKNHGPFVRGNSLEEAFFYLCVVEYSTAILVDLKMLNIDISKLPSFRFPKIDNIPADKLFLIKGSKTLRKNIQKISSDIFYLGLSPYNSGSISLREGREIIFSPQASVPPYLKSNIYQIGLKGNNFNNFFMKLHQAVYRYTRAKSVIFTHSPAGVIQSINQLANKKNSIVPIDLEGKILYPKIPIVYPDEDLKVIVEKAAIFDIIVIAGMGALSIGNSLEQSIRHTSTLKNICLLKTRMGILKNLGILANNIKID